MKFLLEDNALLKDIARNAFGLLSEKLKSPLVGKNNRIRNKAENYITTPLKKKKTRGSRKVRKRKSYARISSMASLSPNKDKSDSADKTESELGDEFEEMNSPKM